MEERTTGQVARGGWRPGFHMKPKHIGLVFCVSLVGCMVAFGAGFVVGMGYKASEQVSPYAVKKPPSAESPGQEKVSRAVWEEESLTFYDTLMNNVPAEMIPAAETTQAPEPTPAAPAPAPQAMGLADASSLDPDPSVVASYSVQVASFLTPERAERLIRELTKKGYRAYVHPFEAPGKPSWYRVKVGTFADRATADVALQKLRSRTPDAMITRD